MESKANSINPTSLKNWQAYCIEKQRSTDYLPFQGDDLSDYKTWLENRYHMTITVSKHFKAIQDIALLPTLKVIEIFIQKYPIAFNPENPVPLAIGIEEVLIAELTEVHPQAIKSALNQWCNHSLYKTKLLKLKHRYNLDGSIAYENEMYEPTFNPYKTINFKDIRESVAAKALEIVDIGTAAVTAIKIRIPVKVSELPLLPTLKPGEATPGIKLMINSYYTMITAKFNGKSYRRALKEAWERGPDTRVIIIGKLGDGGELLNAGLTVQPARQKTVAA